jgi:ankyrin repeat protein
MDPTEGTSNKSLLLGLPNELFLEVASHIPSIKDLNSLVRTSCFFHGMFNTHLYGRAVAADGAVLNKIVGRVLSRYQLSSLMLLLDHGLSVNHTGKFDGSGDEQTLLFFLCGLEDNKERSVESVPMARLLIERGTNTKDKGGPRGDTVLHKAIQYGNYGIAALLLKNGADCKAVNEWKDTPLHQAFRYWAVNDFNMIHMLILCGASINELNEDGETPLLLAMSLCNSAVVPVIPVLLKQGAKADISDDKGYTALHYACKWFDSKHEKLAKLLLKRGANVHATDQDGLTPLHWAIQDHESDGFFMAKFLLENGADVNAYSEDLEDWEYQRSPLQCALSCSGTDSDIIKLLLKHGADVHVLNRAEEAELASAFSDDEGEAEEYGLFFR